MAHKLDRQMKGLSGKLNGYILDNPDRDPNVPILHHVYCTHKKCIFILTKDAYDENVRQLDQNRKNDHHRIEDAAPKIGDYIVFTIEKNQKYGHVILDFEKAENPMDLEFDNGTNVFKSLCVFNGDLNKVYSEHFGEFEVNMDALKALEKIPTPNVVLVCSLSWEMFTDPNGGLTLLPSINKIRHIEADLQEFATKAEWNKYIVKYKYDQYADEEVTFEQSEEQQINAITKQKGFITGLTSVLIPDHPTKTVLLPYHETREHEIGRETKCDIVHNEVLDCYIVFSQRTQISTHYPTFVARKYDDIEAFFYVTIYLDQTFHGFYKHKQFYYIADPYGYLESVRYTFRENPADFEIPRVFTVPIRDRLGQVRDTRKVESLDIITRMEIMGPGDEENQIDTVDQFSKSVRISLRSTQGIVINEREGLVLGYKYNDVRAFDKNLAGFTIKLPRGHNYRNGDHIMFAAKQELDPEFPRPTFYITEHHQNSGQKVCRCDNQGWFELEATYNEKFNCYESYVFGLIPCKKPPPPPSRIQRKTKNLQRRFTILARENQNVPRQTVLAYGEYCRELE